MVIYLQLQSIYMVIRGPQKLNADINCDRICKKGSYTCTTSTHRFHHHSIDTSLDISCVDILWPAVHRSAFPRLLSETCECLFIIQPSLLAVKHKLLGCKVSYGFVVILSTDLNTFCA